MIARSKRYWAGVALAACLLFSPGCIGPGNATAHLAKWNVSFEGKWSQEGIFIVCFPAYIVTALGDMLFFNSIQWWSGTNPISRPAKNDGPRF